VAHHDENDSSFPERQARRAVIAPGAAAGIDEALVQRVVHAFYDRIRGDDLLGPIFDRVIGGRWDTHLARMCDFWSSVLLMSGRYAGQPMPAHSRIETGNPAGNPAGLDERHFDRWLALFDATLAEVCPGEAAALFADRARRIASSLLMGVKFSRGETPDWLRRGTGEKQGQPRA